MSAAEEKKELKYPQVDWDKVLPKLPMDQDGYVQSFEIITNSDDQKVIEENKREIQDFFNKYGVVVIANILNEKELELSCNELFDFVEKNFKGFDRNDPNTWNVIDGLSAKLGMITDWFVNTFFFFFKLSPIIIVILSI